MARTLSVQIEPIAEGREHAAQLMSIACSTFEAHVARGTMPPPRMLGGRTVWLVADLQEAAANLPVSDLLPPPGRRKAQPQ